MGDNEFTKKLKQQMDEFAHFAYRVTKDFPKGELFGATSQLRRASLSVILNYIEGFARQKKAVKRNFWEISYGSLKESKYLFHFCMVEKFMSKTNYEKGAKMADKIGAMLWKSIQSIKN